MTDLAQLSETIKAALPVTNATLSRGELTVEVAAADILAAMTWLQGPGDFKILVDV